MKRSVGVLFLFLAAVVSVVLPNAGCLGNAARQNVGVPATVLASGGVENDARKGLDSLPPDQQAAAKSDVDAFFNAVHSKDRDTIASEAWPRWPVVRGLAEVGIAAKQAEGSVGPGVASSLRERLVRFDEVLTKIVAK